ncbi:MAG: Gfo/Idh/MocA family oxidoreductase [Caldilineaceae bacterium]
MNPIRLALIGAGIFARDAHIPALLRLRDRFELAAIYSRTEATAHALQSACGVNAPIYTDLQTLLHAPEIDALDVVLPIPAMPPIVAQALASGKHVISEKPLAADVATCRQLLAAYRRPEQVWMVAENWRYESAYMQAVALVREGAIGQPRTCQMALYLPMTPSSKYFDTTWRRNSSFAGGALMDGGVHHVAVMRLILGEVTAVSAMTAHTSSIFAGDDTLSATLHFANGVIGSYLVSYAVGAPWSGDLIVVGDAGALRIQRGRIELQRNQATETISCPKFDGVDNELAAFAVAIQQGAPHDNTPEEGLRDVIVVEAMLQAAARGEQIRLE